MPLAKAAKASRASYKGQLTTVKNALNEYAKDETLLLLPSAKIDLGTYLDSIDRIDRKFQEVQMAIIQECAQNEEERQKEQEELIQFMEECAAESARVNRLLRMTNEPQASSPKLPNDEDSPSLSQLLKLMTMQLDEQKKHRESEEKKLQMLIKAQREEFQGYLDQTRGDLGNHSAFDTSMHFAVPSATKLEPVRLPKFSGSYAGWTTFHDLFVSIVDKNSLLTKAQNLDCERGILTDYADNATVKSRL